MAERSLFSRQREIYFARKRELKPDTRAREKGHDQKQRIDQKGENCFFEVLRRDGKYKGKKERKKDDTNFYFQKEMRIPLYSL